MLSFYRLDTPPQEGVLSQPPVRTLARPPARTSAPLHARAHGLASITRSRESPNFSPRKRGEISARARLRRIIYSSRTRTHETKMHNRQARTRPCRQVAAWIRYWLEVLCLAFRKSMIIGVAWKIMLFPNPVGRLTKTSWPPTIRRRAATC